VRLASASATVNTASSCAKRLQQATVAHRESAPSVCYKVICTTFRPPSCYESSSSDPSRASDLREYFRRLDVLAVDNEDGTLNLYLLRPAAADHEERALIHAYLEIWTRTNGIPAELIG
jgi:hypothetical protein